MATFIDFKELREQLDFARVLALYGVEASSVRQQQLSAPCPLPSHLGVRVKATFSADLSRGIWRCFGCKASGNVLDFAVRMEGLDHTNGSAVREVALKLKNHFVDTGVTTLQTSESPTTIAVQVESVVVNAPLDFELKGLDPFHESVAALGLSESTIRHFGLGYCTRGFLKGRIAVPLLNPASELIGYAGRLCEPAAPGEPRYLFPADRRHSGALRRFSVAHFVYGAYLIDPDATRKLIVTDDPALVWHLWELGVPAVAIPSTNLSPFHEDQLDQLIEPARRVFVGRSTHETQ